MSKRFMHVSVAMLCLALAYHLGARSVTAQGSVLEGPDISEGTFTAVSGGTLYYLTSGGRRGSIPGVPGTSPVVASSGNAPATYFRVGLENGDAYETLVEGNWRYVGNLGVGGPTPVEGASLGHVKARWR